MIYVPKHRAAFVHIPKTGGEWVRSAMLAMFPCARYEKRSDKIEPKHSTTSREFIVGDEIDFHFTIVRDPVDWLKSWWKMMHRSNWAFRDYENWHPFNELHKYRTPTFDATVKKILKNSPGEVSRLFYLYCGENGEKMNFIGRFKFLRADLKKAVRMFSDDANVSICDTLKAENIGNKPKIEWNPKLVEEFKMSEPIYRKEWFTSLI